MCATYGLGGGPYPVDDQDFRFDLPPLDDRENASALVEWMRENDHTARITGVNARNLNPLIIIESGRRHLEFAWWWLHLGNKPARFSAFNSRDDALIRRWRSPFQHRALIPATWYVEKGQTFGLDGDVFAIAAITTTAEQPDGSRLLTYSMVTRDAVGNARNTHPRMPLVLPPESHDEWLDPNRPGDLDLVSEMVSDSQELSTSIKAHTLPDAGAERLF